MRNMKSEKDKMRQLNQSVALEQAKKAKNAAQFQAMAKVSGIVEKYAHYHNGIEYGKQHTVKEIQETETPETCEQSHPTGERCFLESNQSNSGGWKSSHAS